jgi:hypothetical protein
MIRRSLILLAIFVTTLSQVLAERETVYVFYPDLFTQSIELLRTNISSLTDLMESKQLTTGLEELHKLRLQADQLSAHYSPETFDELVKVRTEFRTIMTSSGMGQNLIDHHLITAEILNSTLDSIPPEVAVANQFIQKNHPSPRRSIAAARPTFNFPDLIDQLLYGGIGLFAASLITRPMLNYNGMTNSGDYMLSVALVSHLISPLLWNASFSFGPLEGARHWILQNNRRATFYNALIGGTLGICMSVLAHVYGKH